MIQQGAGTVLGRSFIAVAVTGAVVLAPPGTAHQAAVTDPAARLTAAVLPAGPDFQQLAGQVTDVAPASALGDGIIGLYLTLEEWVQYGVDLVSWALRWVPFGGLLASQLNMFYNLGESIVSSLVFNTAYLLDGTVGFGEALSNVGSATVAAFTTFVDAQISWFVHLLPPLPPLPGLEAVPVPDTVADILPELDGILLG